MGTNYYLMTRNKGLVETHFPNRSDYYHVDAGYELTDSPYFGYQIHICKLSCGWKPLFQEHNDAYMFFAGLEDFYDTHSDDLEIFDEYGERLSFMEFKETVTAHSRNTMNSMTRKYTKDPQYEVEWTIGDFS